MPLHLLGKKSWNVYNADNIAKVKRDEAAAAAREEAEEQRMQEVDAERRIQTLRGLRADAPPSLVVQAEDESNRRASQDEPKRERKRRRIAGEDDTVRDIRLAQETSAVMPGKVELQVQLSKKSDAPLTDGKGHINLFPMEGPQRHVPKNVEAEAESAKKKKEFEDQYTMRFSNAAGFKQAVGQKPWYHSLGAGADGEREAEAPTKDVWGNADPRRKERERNRMVADDPLATIHKGVIGLREVERDRRKWKEEKDREIRELVDAERQRKRRRRKEKEEYDEFEGFSLETPVKSDGERRLEDKGKERTSRHRHHERNHSREHSRRTSYHHRHKSRKDENMEQEHGERRRSKHNDNLPAPASNSNASPTTAEESMAKMRKERDDRELAERARAAKLLAKSSIDTRPGWEIGSGGRYSSQFAYS